MPRIRFTTDPKLPRDLAHLGYVTGTEIDLSEDQAGRWLRRGVAEVVPLVAVVAEVEPEPPAPETPNAPEFPTASTDPAPRYQHGRRR
jgi:hypothetical protein